MNRSTRMSRRRALASLGTGTAAVLAGCTSVDGEPVYDDGEIGDVDGEGRTAEEMTAAQAVAEQEVHDEATPLEMITITEHEFVVEEGYTGPTVQGIVENTGDNRVKTAEVRTRVYDDDGNQLGRYVDSTGDIDGKATWEFQVVILESPGDIANYDIAVLGIPT